MGKRSASTSPRALKRHSHAPSAPQDSYMVQAADTWIAIGNCATTIGMIAVAMKSFESALTHTPDSVDALIGWSFSLRMNDISANETVGSQTSIQRLTRAAEQFPELTKSSKYYRELTESYLLVGLNEQAHQSIQSAMQLKPNDPALCLLSAQTLIRAGARAQAAIAAADGNIDLSIAELTATLSLPPPPLARADEYIALWCAFATAKERANRIDEALEACERAEVAVGPSPRILITHAYLLLLNFNKENTEKAVDLLTKVVEAEPQELREPKESDDGNENSPGDFLPWYLLGKAYNLLDSPRAAYDSYQIALRRASSSPITWLAVGKLYLELKQLPDALAAYSQALRLQLNENSPGTAAAWEGLSCVYERCDDQLADAADACSRAAMCFRAFHDNETADYYDNRAKKLQAAAQGNGPVPSLTQPSGVPNYFLRDLVTLLPSERIAFVQGSNKAPNGDAKREGTNPAAQDQPAGRDKYPQYGPPSYSDAPYPGRNPQGRSYEGPVAGDGMHQMGRTIPPPMPPQPQQFNNSPGPPHPAYPPDRTPQQMHQLAQPFKPDNKSPGQPTQLPPPGPRHWGLQEPMAHQAPPHIYQGQVPLQGQYPPPPNGMMTPPSIAQGPGQGPHRSPLAHPHVMGEGYPVANHPGYVYGQYMPMHGGMLAHVQPYAGTTNWRQ